MSLRALSERERKALRLMLTAKYRGGNASDVLERQATCHQLGLADRQIAALTGFSSRVVGALAHLREAWLVADESNAQAIEAAIRALLRAHSLQGDGMRAVCRAVLTHRLDVPDQAGPLLELVGLE